METAQIILSSSVAETEACGAALARRMQSDPSLPPFVALFGDLGVGKTAFVRGFTGVISPASAVRSPTFALVREYPAKPRPVFHFDMYRITDEDAQMLRRQKRLNVFAPFHHADAGAVQIIVEPDGDQLVLIGDPVHIKVKDRARLGRVFANERKGW